MIKKNILANKSLVDLLAKIKENIIFILFRSCLSSKIDLVFKIKILSDYFNIFMIGIND